METYNLYAISCKIVQKITAIKGELANGQLYKTILELKQIWKLMYRS